MKTRAGFQLLLFGTLLVALSGCASYPVSKNLRQEAKPVTLAQVAANPGAYTGTIVIWGGRVIQTANDTNGGSLYVLQLPLNRYETPTWHGPSSGRFIARSKDFIDPEVFKKGRLVTIAGEVTGVVTKPVQTVQYAHPVVGIRELHPWHVVSHPPYFPGGYWGWYGPGWYGPGWYGPPWGYYGLEWDWY